jgi:uncharacterized protein (TIGR04222 family)
MMVFAAPGDTWGISGPSFLGIFALAYAVVLALSLVFRHAAVRGRPAQRELHPYEAALLVGGRGRAIAASLAALYSAKVITAAGAGQFQVISEPRMTLTPLDDAIVRAIGQGMNTNVRTLPLHPGVRRALGDLEGGLIGAGLSTGPGERARARLAALPLALLCAVGGVRIWAGIQNGKPVSFIVLAVIIVGLTWLGMVITTPDITGAGRRALAAARIRNRVLRPSMSPSWATYGPTGAALGVALFGGAALYSLDPAFAQASEMRRGLGVSSGTSGTSWSSSSSSSSCNSSSCGSSASSCSSSSCGSSCGGGGCGG